MMVSFFGMIAPVTALMTTVMGILTTIMLERRVELAYAKGFHLVMVAWSKNVNLESRKPKVPIMGQPAMTK